MVIKREWGRSKVVRRDFIKEIDSPILKEMYLRRVTILC